MAKLFPHLTREIENELVRAVEESNDGYPHHLRDMQVHYEWITDEMIDVVSEALWEGEMDGRQAAAHDESLLPYPDVPLGADSREAGYRED